VSPPVGPPSSTANATRTPSSSCPVAGAEITVGAAMPPTSTAPLTIPAGVTRAGAYLTAAPGSIAPADLWFVGGGTAQRIASISGDSITRLRIDDVGPSGRNVALRVGYGDDTSGGCDDLYVIRSDRESMTRVTRNGPGRHAVEGLMSSDDR